MADTAAAAEAAAPSGAAGAGADPKRAALLRRSFRAWMDNWARLLTGTVAEQTFCRAFKETRKR
jgi:hypothetical protein